MSEIRADQQLPFFRWFRDGWQTGTDLVEAAHQELVDFHVAIAEFGPYLLQQRVNFAFGKGHDLGANIDRPTVIVRRNGRSSTRVRSGSE